MVFSELERSDIVVLENVDLEGFEELALDEKLGDLGLDSHSVQVSHKALHHVGFTLGFPLTDAEVSRLSDPEKFCEWSLKG